ncbi:hypothetical protein B0P06_005242 [Clostridium saccharoperbutylacetonicum]|uniref:Uncharacterized protein n=1 Tax=Clostridium saccharoperbutylacetonicum N1-4(HMT) TaxID=931276 RepID=M1MEZ2_9CLOT|nr:hypothetical protein [Clostridium saccharoperbutylacetonicum]AGF56489.1 hypothetical protein Cspa_c27240 [Clostridium saccharoperbutylacetonicum N1-4(HMT)]NRT62764.1 hypothetical protein [Clostridium saccharoperbutylacetonicum]NSB26116.1 hypothetical protein [Clostridium saccharoperbutylacetonicum]NSB45471.1 hypothetical protein [Clostridium saccharoperbutylacetonicum]
MANKYTNDSDYILEILEEEEERLLQKLGTKLYEDDKHLFFRYVSVRDTMEDIKLKTI